jgi:hypothetical protein
MNRASLHVLIQIGKCNSREEFDYFIEKKYDHLLFHKRCETVWWLLLLSKK